MVPQKQKLTGNDDKIDKPAYLTRTLLAGKLIPANANHIAKAKVPIVIEALKRRP